MNDDLHLDVAADDAVTTVAVHGELDLATVGSLMAGIESDVLGRAAKPVVLDLAGCGFIDSTGARTIVQVGRRVEAEGRRFSIVSPPESGARFTLDLLGVADSFPVHDALGPAVAALSGRAG